MTAVAFAPVCPLCGSSVRLEQASGRDAVRWCTRCGLGERVAEPIDQASHFDAVALRPLSRARTRAEESRALKRARLLLRWLGREDGKGLRLLEVGPGRGFFAKAAARAGFDVTLVELSPAYAAFLRGAGFTVHEGPVERVAAALPRVDVVLADQVLEHVGDPKAFVRAAASLCLPGGLVVLGVPNGDSVVARLYGRRWALRSHEHRWYFSRRALGLLVGESGCKTIVQRSLPVGAGIVACGVARSLLEAPRRERPLRLGIALAREALNAAASLVNRSDYMVLAARAGGGGDRG